MSHWIAVFTQPQAEHVARAQIEAAGVGTFCPAFTVGSWRGDRLQLRERALLPRYLFAHVADDGDWPAIHNCNGVDHVLTVNDAPARVADADVARLMLSHAMHDHDVIAPRDPGGRFRRRKRRRRRPRHGRIATGSPPQRP